MRQLKDQYSYLGIFAAIGGLLWIAWVMITASRPLLPPHGYRDNDDIAILMGVSMLFMAVGILGIFSRQKSKMTWCRKNSTVFRHNGCNSGSDWKSIYNDLWQQLHVGPYLLWRW